MRPSRKFSQPKGNDDSLDDELREKQALRAQRLAALAEETFDADEWAKRKSEFASQLQDEYVSIEHKIDMNKKKINQKICYHRF